MWDMEVLNSASYTAEYHVEGWGLAMTKLAYQNANEVSSMTTGSLKFPSGSSHIGLPECARGMKKACHYPKRAFWTAKKALL
jgi:hypothetical protein